MKVMIKTKSNYRGLNGTWLTVHEAVNKRISCIVNDPEAKDGKLIVDFDISEITMISYSSETK